MSNPFEQIMSNPELFKVASTHHFHGHECLCGFVSPVSRQRTEHIVCETLAAALPEVTSVEELDQLPDMSVVLDGDGFVLQKLPDDDDDSYWFIVGDTSSYYERDITLPARVLYRPSEQP